MKQVIALVALAALTGSAYAQVSPLPPSSSLNGVTITNTGPQTNWATSSLASYKFQSDLDLNSPKPGVPDNVLGLNWGSTTPTGATNLKNAVNAEGGFIRSIFLGESARWLNDIGYTYDGKPTPTSNTSTSNSFTVLSNIQSLAGTPAPVNVAFGDYFDVKLGAGLASKFDFWLNGVGAFGATTPSSTTYGGVYTVFDQSNSNPVNAPGNVKWTASALSVSTWVAGYIDAFGNAKGNEFKNIDTYLVGIEDWNLNTADKDYNDYMFAVQFLDANGDRISDPVPEPSTYGLIGAVALLGLVAARRFKSKK